MGVVIFICIMVVLGLVVMFLGAPLRMAREGAAAGEDAAEQARARSSISVREELETARESKYREIRDAELDFRTGKLSESDYAAIDADLRAEALTILDALERAEVGSSEPAGSGPGGLE
jgi:hypothetical protein